MRTSHTFDVAEILFIVATSIEQEFEITKIVNRIEKDFKKNGLDIESNFVNKNNAELNNQFIQADYPNSLEISIIKDAFKRLSPGPS